MRSKRLRQVSGMPGGGLAIQVQHVEQVVVDADWKGVSARTAVAAAERLVTIAPVAVAPSECVEIFALSRPQPLPEEYLNET